MIQSGPLIFPRGIRFPRLDEVPDGAPSDSDALMAAALIAKITPGYRLHPVAPGRSFSGYIEANVHAPQLWDVFVALCRALLPAGAAPLVGQIDEDTILGDYTTREAAIGVLAPYADALVNDGFLEFGCMFQRTGHTEEIFVPSAKYLRIWTNQPKIATRTLRAHGIQHVPDVKFIDEFPLLREVQPYRSQHVGFEAVLEELAPKLHQLPPRPELVESGNYQFTVD